MQEINYVNNLKYRCSETKPDKMSCVVYSCKNKGVHMFPADEQRHAQWIKATRLDMVRKIGRPLKPYSRICSYHFKNSDFIVSPRSSDGNPGSKRLKINSVPSVFSWTSPVPSETFDNDTVFDASKVLYDYSKKKKPEFVNTCIKEEQDDPLKLFKEDNEDNSTSLSSELEVKFEVVLKKEKEEIKQKTLSIDNTTESSQTPAIINFLLQQDEKKVEDLDQIDKPVLTKSQALQTDNLLKDISIQTEEIRLPLSVHMYRHHREAIQFYTGLESFEKLELVFDTLGNSVHNLKYLYSSPAKHFGPFEQFFMTLIKLKLQKSFRELSFLYMLPIKQLSDIFVTWIRLMTLQWKNLNLWIDKATVKAYMPLCFQEKYPKTRAILEVLEVPINKPADSTARQITLSPSKNKHTVKALIGFAPSGLVTYVSPCYGGSASETEIIEKSDLPQCLEIGDEIMFARELNVGDIFLPYGVKVNMLGSYKKSGRSIRVAIEKVIGRLNSYKILTQPMQRTEVLLSSDIIFVCAMLTNFKSSK